MIEDSIYRLCQQVALGCFRVKAEKKACMRYQGRSGRQTCYMWSVGRSFRFKQMIIVLFRHFLKRFSQRWIAEKRLD